MRISALVLGPLLGLGLGCSNANKKIDEFADRACACQDVACGDQVNKEFLAWAKENSDARGDQDQAKKSWDRMQGCIMKLKDVAKPDPMEKSADKKADAEKKVD